MLGASPCGQATQTNVSLSTVPAPAPESAVLGCHTIKTTISSSSRPVQQGQGQVQAVTRKTLITMLGDSLYFQVLFLQSISFWKRRGMSILNYQTVIPALLSILNRLKHQLLYDGVN